MTRALQLRKRLLSCVLEAQRIEGRKRRTADSALSEREKFSRPKALHI